MRFMLLLKGDPQIDTSPGAAPPAAPTELIAAMHRYNDELAKAGVLLAAEGLHPSAMGGAQVVKNSGGGVRVVDGPFAEAKELVAGFYMIDVKSLDEAVEWARRCPVELACSGDMEAVVEVRQISETVQEVYPDA